MDKRKLKAITWTFVVLTTLIVALMLMNTLRRTSRVTLPDTSTSIGDSTQEPNAGDALTVVGVEPETVQAAVATLQRPESYCRSMTVEYLWNGGSGAVELAVSVLGSWQRVDRTLPDGQIRHVITDGETTYIWYNEETAVYTGPAGDIDGDTEQTIPTYEDVLALPLEDIIKADYRTVSDVSCIYVETAETSDGYAQRYWISVDTGLLVVAERLLQGKTVYRMAALTLDQRTPTAETFTLPDGTVLAGN